MKVDSEVIDEIIDAAHEIFLHSAKHEAGQTALRALDVRWLDGQQIIGLKTDYSALEAATRRKCESAISSLTRASVSGSAVAVFETLASAIDKDPPSGIPADVSDLIVTYVAVVATLWRRIGLRPSRATHPENPKYKSRFHRFVELVLTAMTEPWSNRRSHDIDQIARGAWAAHARLAPEIRTKISARLRREDREWLVTSEIFRVGGTRHSCRLRPYHANL
jgi:hypothetical protein